MEIIKQNFFMIVLITISIVAWVYITKKEKERDGITDYSTQDLGGRFNSLPSNNGTGLFFRYNKKTQPMKKQFILDNYAQGTEVENIQGYAYEISELLNDEYYDILYNSDGSKKSKTGPYIVYKVIPKNELKRSDIKIDRTNGPVQVTTGSGDAHQNIVNSSFSSIVSDYKDLMVSNGILEEDIDAVLRHPNDNDVKQSFLSKYGIDLAKITVEVAGVVTSLLTLLKS
ncbi:hypothetical protein [Enterococcus sp. AZ163]|uniref:hypothetical protein n=1 Tax=Enterococcus sp. AZ163 TaxID=2774638 RepID=UPI003D288998